MELPERLRPDRQRAHSGSAWLTPALHRPERPPSFIYDIKVITDNFVNYDV
jgi:hypothetical protein